MNNQLKITFIGGGNMATALIGGLATEIIPAANIHVVDPEEAALERLRSHFKVSTAQQIDATVAGKDRQRHRHHAARLPLVRLLLA